MPDPRNALGLFDGFGIEIEEMVVDAQSLDVRPFADRALVDEAGAVVSDVPRGAIAWCNELSAHVVEMKNDGPAPSMDGLIDEFQASVREIDARLAVHGARLMPTGMHPWMDPYREAVLWQHDWSAVYDAFDRIFDCRGHGWSNLQSVQINLPFADDEEFARLHAAIRFLLPIMPALTASTPFVEGVATGRLDNRMLFYRGNCARVPSIAGLVVPEDWRTREAYENTLLRGIHRDLAPLDPDGVLQQEWVNSRGAIARFDRGAIEIRILDTQECPAADLAVLAAIVGVLRALVSGRPVDLDAQAGFSTERLAGILWRVVEGGDGAIVEDEDYLRALGHGRGPASAGEVWRGLVERHLETGAADAVRWRDALAVILDEGCLARRVLAAVGTETSRDALRAVYRELCDCLVAGRSFRVADR
jgi:gamma-glutamyl:cysteine ligase YbdK (ATP-grasp superfamily)